MLLYAMVNYDESLFNLYGSQLVKSGASLTAPQTVLLDGMRRCESKASAGKSVSILPDGMSHPQGIIIALFPKAEPACRSHSQ